MIRLTSRFRVVPIGLALVAGVSCWPMAAWAQAAPVDATQADAAAAAAAAAAPAPADDTIRLTDEERLEILNNNTMEKAAAARGELPDAQSPGPGRGIHGEVGVMIGSHGTRGAYGTADIPLGENARATVSVESSTFGYRR